jgi:monofunctional biosynthetic peptidoglycan transglycosylase
LDKKPYFRKRGFFRRLARTFLKIILYGFLFSVFYILLCKWVNPPITITQISSFITGHGLKRDYIKYDEMSANIKLAVLA